MTHRCLELTILVMKCGCHSLPDAQEHVQWLKNIVNP